MATETSAFYQMFNARATWVTIESGGFLYGAYTLDGVLGLWVASVLDGNASLAGQTPLAAADTFARNFLAAHPGVDGSQINILVPAYAAFLDAALAGAPLPQLPPPPYTPVGVRSWYSLHFRLEWKVTASLKPCEKS